jgi:phage baseplate assembly protein W
MANYDASNTNNSIRSNRIYSDLNLNFTKNPATKDVARLTDVEAVKRSVRNLILTNRFERPFHPEIGSSIRDLLFEPITPLHAVLLEDRIEEVIVNYEPRVTLNQIIVQDEIDNNRYAVTISFYVNNTPEPVTITEFLQRLR